MIKFENVVKRECENCYGDADIRVTVGDAEFIICNKCARQLQEALIVQQSHNDISITIQEDLTAKAKVKTMLDDFKEKHPNALLIDGVPAILPTELGYCGSLCKNCSLECWYNPLEE